MDDIYYMNVALKEAKKAFKKNEIPIGAILVKNNRIVAKGYNLKETKNNPLKHAEMIVIEKGCKKLKNWRLNDCTLYVTMCPCPMCASAINQARISKVVYGTIPEYTNKKIVYEILNDNNYGNTVEVVENVLYDECTDIIRKFFKKKR